MEMIEIGNRLRSRLVQAAWLKKKKKKEQTLKCSMVHCSEEVLLICSFNITLYGAVLEILLSSQRWFTAAEI